MECHREGMGIQEIAEKFGTTSTTVYRYLEEIARENGMTREELLERVHSPHVMTKETEKAQKADSEQSPLCDFRLYRQ